MMIMIMIMIIIIIIMKMIMMMVTIMAMKTAHTQNQGNFHLRLLVQYAMEHAAANPSCVGVCRSADICEKLWTLTSVPSFLCTTTTTPNRGSVPL